MAVVRRSRFRLLPLVLTHMKMANVQCVAQKIPTIILAAGRILAAVKAVAVKVAEPEMVAIPKVKLNG